MSLEVWWLLCLFFLLFFGGNLGFSEVAHYTDVGCCVPVTVLGTEGLQERQEALDPSDLPPALLTSTQCNRERQFLVLGGERLGRQEARRLSLCRQGGRVSPRQHPDAVSALACLDHQMRQVPGNE